MFHPTSLQAACGQNDKTFSICILQQGFDKVFVLQAIKDQYSALGYFCHIERCSLVGVWVCPEWKQAIDLHALPCHVLSDISKEGGGGEHLQAAIIVI